MKLIKKFAVIFLAVALIANLTACSNFESKSKESIDSYMQNLKSLTQENYIDWVDQNLGNPYSGAGLELSQLREGQIVYFINCLEKISYEIVSVDKTNKTAEVNVTYVDSTEYITNLFGELMAYAFSENYTEEGESQIYIDVMNEITEYQFMNDTIYFSLNDDATIEMASSNVFDVVTAGLYKLMLGDPAEATSQGTRYSQEELLANIDVDYKVLDEGTILVSFTNNNEVAVYPVASFIFMDANGNEVIQSQANVEALPAGATSYTYAYNELNDEVVDFRVEMQTDYYNPEDITFFDESLIPYEIKQEDDMVSIIFTNNTDETIDICGGCLVYGKNNEIMLVSDIYISYLAPGESESTWFYLSSTYDEKTDTWLVDSYDHLEIHPIAHTQAPAIICS